MTKVMRLAPAEPDEMQKKAALDDARDRDLRDQVRGLIRAHLQDVSLRALVEAAAEKVVQEFVEQTVREEMLSLPPAALGEALTVPLRGMRGRRSGAGMEVEDSDARRSQPTP